VPRMHVLSVVRLRRMLIAFALLGAGLVLSGAARASAGTCESAQTPNVESDQNWLTGVSVTSNRNAWAVGAYYYGTVAKLHVGTLIEHWNGTAWTVQTSPNLRGYSNGELLGVAGTSSRNAWAVGYATNQIGVSSSRTQALIEHWTGRAWKIQTSPKLGASQLSGVTATSSTNAWAVGYTFHAVGGNVETQALIEHWTGRAWKIQTSPKLGASQLSGVTATSSRNAWAVGKHGNRALIEHWDGRAWTVQASPNPRFFKNQAGIQLSGVAATSSSNGWAVGSYYSQEITPDAGSQSQSLIEHWNGRAWKVQASPNTGGFSNFLSGVAATSSTNAWAVGAPSVRARPRSSIGTARPGRPSRSWAAPPTTGSTVLLPPHPRTCGRWVTAPSLCIAAQQRVSGHKFCTPIRQHSRSSTPSASGSG
jgi:hypothetical protein